MRSFGRSSDLSVASNRPIAFPVLRHHSRVSPQWPVAFLLRADGSQACGEPRALSSSVQFRPGPTVVTSRAKRSEECFVPRRDSCCADLPKRVRRDLPRRSTEDPVLVHDPRAWAGGDESLPIRRRAPMPLVRRRCDAVPCTRQGSTSHRASSRSPSGPARRERRSGPRRTAPFARSRPKSRPSSGTAPKHRSRREHLTEARHSTAGAIGIASTPARASTGASSE